MSPTPPLWVFGYSILDSVNFGYSVATASELALLTGEPSPQDRMKAANPHRVGLNQLSGVLDVPVPSLTSEGIQRSPASTYNSVLKRSVYLVETM